MPILAQDAPGEKGEFLLVLHRTKLKAKEKTDETIDHAGTDPEYQHRSGHYKELGGGAGNIALWLCQDRHTVFSEFFQLPPKWGALIVLACRYKFKPARSTHIYLNLS